MPVKTTTMVNCPKCGGSGQYLSYGVCFGCSGRRKIKCVTETAEWWVEYPRYDALTQKGFDTKAEAWAFVQGEWGDNALCRVFHSPDMTAPVWEGMRFTDLARARAYFDQRHENDCAAIRFALKADLSGWAQAQGEMQQCCGFYTRDFTISGAVYTAFVDYGH